MNLRTAYTFLLLQFPPFAVGLASIVIGFLSASIPAVKLARVGAGLEAMEGGVRWGGTAAAAVALVLGLVTLWLLRRAEAEGPARRKAAWSLLAAALIGWVGAVGGAFLGTLAGGHVGTEALLTETLATAWLGWPAGAAALAMAAALALSAVRTPQ